jgi:DNA-binding Lrp family transcriptional regulator
MLTGSKKMQKTVLAQKSCLYPPLQDYPSAEKMTSKDLAIISHLRLNARRKVTEISRMVNVPVTTIYDMIRSKEKKGIFKKSVTLMDFNKMGFSISVLLALTVGIDKRDALLDHLMKHPNVNSLYKCSFRPDFLAEVVFEDQGRLAQFIDNIRVNFDIVELKEYNILQELKKEQFLSARTA